MELIKINNINKFYPHVVTNKQRVKGMLKILFNRNENDGAHILKDINLTVNKGESLAIIGHNGAGKSTLLKILSGVIQPSSGSFKVNGKVGALLELGSGFDPEYSGMENLKMATAMNGIVGKEANEKISKMIEFADIGDYIYEPVKNYSSGMVVRLGFSVITQIRPELLITDEVLAVGDEGFQLKCLKWIDDYLQAGGTLLLVSHSVYHVQKLCKKAVWLDHGAIKKYGDVFEITQAYQESFSDPNKLPSGVSVNRTTYHIHDAIIDYEGQAVEEVEFGQAVKLVVKVYSPDQVIPNICIGFVTHNGIPVYGTYSELYDTHPYFDESGYAIYEVYMPNLQLLPGLYEVRFHTMTPENIQMIDTFEKPLRVLGKTRELGATRLEMVWK
ncbi:MAG: polysaccharide ABC transporter ATP-binding protein [Marinicella sp.]